MRSPPASSLKKAGQERVWQKLYRKMNNSSFGEVGEGGRGGGGGGRGGCWEGISK